ncbi:hypothetical protein SERLADRAFT_468553 [Serpula lacrymans var. lacrymans S7.9]|uniref:Uncharacterized protein n=1 Tax=Serpula lacrymans var. lacrymans (strain S7.9) TaxID=578457 RepID=F8NXU7_SERL9|nr:uncharacterized protein SERLADRAFT_468553 [Serpula lacrymans var. lacrymans S7.9]EGO24763.1 hypothetical protein SERLADRAFT_468553 [Serpula lacrymans var. lacrymans S7.9]
MVSVVSFLSVALAAVLYDENFRIFAVSTLVPSFGVLPQCGTFTLPLVLCEPKSTVERGPLFECAKWKAGVGAMRVVNDLPLDV